MGVTFVQSDFKIKPSSIFQHESSEATTMTTTKMSALATNRRRSPPSMLFLLLSAACLMQTSWAIGKTLTMFRPLYDTNVKLKQCNHRPAASVSSPIFPPPLIVLLPGVCHYSVDCLIRRFLPDRYNQTTPNMQTHVCS